METKLAVALVALTAVSSPAQEQAGGQAPMGIDPKVVQALFEFRQGQVWSGGSMQGQPQELGVPDIGAAKSIWSETMTDIQQVWFRHTFEVPKGAKGGKLVFTCDNRCTVYLNGDEIASADDWEKLTVADLCNRLRPGKNVVAIDARNEGSCAALVAWVVWEDENGAPTGVVSSDEWKACDEEQDGWQKVDHDDSQWDSATVTGETPFGHNVHRGAPRGIVFRNGFTKSADEVEAALATFRSARDLDAAQKALDRIEHAVMELRAQVWKAREERTQSRVPAGK